MTEHNRYSASYTRSIREREMAENPSHDDASTGTPFRDIRPGDVFRTASGFRGTKRANGQCVDYRDGGDVMLDGDVECWRIAIGGWIK
jgi:hypothetical protein